MYDRLAQLQVTINGQLMTMSLVEELELNGIHVISANTDGLIIKCPRNKFDVYLEITDNWNTINKMSADYEVYNKFVTRDVNNYFDIQTNGTIEFKGSFNPKQYLKELKKGFDMPVVAKAVFEYFANDVPIMTTLQNHKDILDFCKTQNIGRKFKICYDTVVNGEVKTTYTQRHVRFYVSNWGIIITKENSETHEREVLASGKSVILLNSLDDKPIEERNINYKYYYDECYKLINPIKLGISTNQKGNKTNGTVSGKVLISKYEQQYLTLFDEE